MTIIRPICAVPAGDIRSAPQACGRPPSDWPATIGDIERVAADIIREMSVPWEHVSDKPEEFPPSYHHHEVDEIDGLDALITERLQPYVKSGDLPSWLTKDFAEPITDVSNKADLVNGMVPSSQLPSYVDDVLEFASESAFPQPGESGKIYIALDTNKTYRWGGTAYAEISKSLAIGETAETAGAGDKTKVAYEHALITTGNPHGTTFASLPDKPTIPPEVTFDEEVTETSERGVKSKGIWSWVKGLFSAIFTENEYGDLSFKKTTIGLGVDADYTTGVELEGAGRYRSISFPMKSGTVALTSDQPIVYTIKDGAIWNGTTQVLRFKALYDVAVVGRAILLADVKDAADGGKVVMQAHQVSDHFVRFDATGKVWKGGDIFFDGNDKIVTRSVYAVRNGDWETPSTNDGLRVVWNTSADELMKKEDIEDTFAKKSEFAVEDTTQTSRPWVARKLTIGKDTAIIPAVVAPSEEVKAAGKAADAQSTFVQLEQKLDKERASSWAVPWESYSAQVANFHYNQTQAIQIPIADFIHGVEALMAVSIIFGKSSNQTQPLYLSVRAAKNSSDVLGTDLYIGSSTNTHNGAELTSNYQYQEYTFNKLRIPAGYSYLRLVFSKVQGDSVSSSDLVARLIGVYNQTVVPAVTGYNLFWLQGGSWASGPMDSPGYIKMTGYGPTYVRTVNGMSGDVTVSGSGATVLTSDGSKIYKNGVEMTSYAALLALVQAGGVTLMGTVGADKDALYYPQFCDVNAIRFDATGTLGGDVKTKSYTVQPVNGDHIRITEGSLVDLAKKTDIPTVVAPASDTALSGKASDAYETGKKLEEKRDRYNLDYIKYSPADWGDNLTLYVDGEFNGSYGEQSIVNINGKFKLEKVEDEHDELWRFENDEIKIELLYVNKKHSFMMVGIFYKEFTKDGYVLSESFWGNVNGEEWRRDWDNRMPCVRESDGVEGVLVTHHISMRIDVSPQFMELATIDDISLHEAGGLTPSAKALLFTDTAFSQKLHYALNNDGTIKDRAVNKLTWTAESESHSFSLDANLPAPIDGVGRDFLVQIHTDAAVDITSALALKGDLPSITEAGDYILAFTELHDNMWLVKKLTLEDAQ